MRIEFANELVTIPAGSLSGIRPLIVVGSHPHKSGDGILKDPPHPAGAGIDIVFIILKSYCYCNNVKKKIGFPNMNLNIIIFLDNIEKKLKYIARALHLLSGRFTGVCIYNRLRQDEADIRLIIFLSPPFSPPLYKGGRGGVKKMYSKGVRNRLAP